MPNEQEGRKLEEFDRNMAANAAGGSGLDWYSPTEAPFRLSGFGWFEKDRVYRRMPLEPDYPISEAVDSLSNHTAGGQIAFRSDAVKLAVNVELSGPSFMCHMPATGQCGFDCYAGEPGEQVFVGSSKYDHSKASYEVLLFDVGAQPQMRQFTLNFPLYQGVKRVSIGLNSGAQVLAPAPFSLDKPVVIYGTSITQGGCAARPGMAYTNILSRRLNIECINLGFSGSGMGEPEIAKLITQISEPACIVLDYEANAGPEGTVNTLEAFIDILRDSFPLAPILVVSKTRYPRELFDPQTRETRLRIRDFQRGVVEGRNRAGDARIFFFDGGELLGDDFHECSVDGSHPTDLGFYRMAGALEPALREILF